MQWTRLCRQRCSGLDCVGREVLQALDDMNQKNPYGVSLELIAAAGGGVGIQVVAEMCQ